MRSGNSFFWARIREILLTLLVTLTSFSAVAPDVAPPEPVAIVPALIDPEFNPRLGTYYYRFQWMLRIGADATIKIECVDDVFSVSTEVSTGWFVDRIYRLRYRGTARIRAEDFALISAHIREEVRRTLKDAQIEQREGMIYSERVRTRRNRIPRHQSYEHSTREGRVTDPFAATLIARAVPWEVGDLRTIDVFDGRRINRVTLECTGTARVEAAGEMHDALRIHVSVTQGDPEDIEEDDELITDQVEVFIAADSSREVLRVEADTKYGGIKVILEEFVPTDG